MDPIGQDLSTLPSLRRVSMNPGSVMVRERRVDVTPEVVTVVRLLGPTVRLSSFVYDFPFGRLVVDIRFSCSFLSPDSFLSMF